jgi:hypothetical protein
MGMHRVGCVYFFCSYRRYGKSNGTSAVLSSFDSVMSFYVIGGMFSSVYIRSCLECTKDRWFHSEGKKP